MTACQECGRRDGWAPTFRLLLRANRLLRGTRRKYGALSRDYRLLAAKYGAERVLRTEAESQAEAARCELIDEAAKVRRLEAQLAFLTGSLSAEMDEAWGAWLNGEGGVG